MTLFSRRRLIISTFGILAAVPVARIVVLRSKDNLLPAVSAPHLVLVDGWLLDANDDEPLDNSG